MLRVTPCFRKDRANTGPCCRKDRANTEIWHVLDTCYFDPHVLGVIVLSIHRALEISGTDICAIHRANRGVNTEIIIILGDEPCLRAQYSNPA